MLATKSSIEEDPTVVFENVQRRLETESRQIAAERQALCNFVEELQSIPTTEKTAHSIPSVTTTSGDGIAAVRESYQSTVMAVPHYEEEYGDTYAQSVSQEFGPMLGTILTEKTHFNEQCRNTLITAVEQSLRERAHLADQLDTEQASIEDVHMILAPVIDDLDTYQDCTFAEEDLGSLDAYRARLSALSDRCEKAASTRQATIRAQRNELQMPTDAPDMPKYLYRDLDPNYPLLSLVVTLSEQIDELERDIGMAIAV
jgi:hypothetical protein